MAKINELKSEMLPHASYSPDLAASDYFLFPNLRKWLGGRRFLTNTMIYADDIVILAKSIEELQTKIDYEPIPITNALKYLDSTISPNGKIDGVITGCVNAGWMKWRSVTRILCNKKFPIKLKDIEEKLLEKQLRWYGYAMRQDEVYVVRKTLDFPIPNRRPGRPSAIWLGTVNRNMKK
ncbi:uncharacterized protein LOC129608410 [Condylostylus longicornis]|uniref:uncharacterized protein LOC129608410 n=1 Tax=Condylostylus longicornis TaxID=2530218 RepID=UPI00244E3275|nr:uncharacterized protein LOC129608410 [Condylostylus longicornis]